MTITFYNTTSDKRMLNKTLTNAKSITGDIKQETSIISPIFIVNSNIQLLSNYNYLYVSELDRYYYINDVTISKNCIIVSCEIDVLMTYKNSINCLNCNIIRQEHHGLSNIVDNEITVKTDCIIECAMMSNSQLNLKTANNDSTNFVLGVAGG